jgi:hypothetical protein
MKLSEFTAHLNQLTELNFIEPNGNPVPKHFHITEAGLTTKHFIDCGGTIRTEKTASMQIWVAQDTNHRLEPKKLKKIIELAEPILSSADLDIEIEYQAETVGRYNLTFSENNFMLLPKATDCLAKDNCGQPKEKKKLQLAELQTEKKGCCSPESNCC